MAELLTQGGRRVRRRALSAALVAVCSTSLAAQEPPADFGPAGTWTGSWIRAGDTLAVTMHLEKADGEWRGEFDSGRLRVEGIPFQEVAFDPLRLSLLLVGDETTLEFDGRIDRDSLFGTFTEGEARGRFVFFRDSRLFEGPPEEEVRFRSGDVELAGTLVLPFGTPPHPAVVFLHGSGAEGRWASAYLARRLAREGIAALIWDKRGVGGSTGSWQAAGFEELAADAAAAVAFLRARPEIDSQRVGIHGHSQGGTIAPLAAVRSGADFVIASAAAGVFTADAEIYSLANSVELDSLPPEEAALARAYIAALVDVAYRGAPREALDSLAARADGRDWFFPLPEPDHSYWTFSRRIADFDPLAWWRRVEVPVLLVYGSEDERVPVEESRAAIVRAIEQGKGAPVEMRVFQGADHTFRVRRPGDVWPRTVEGYPEAILDWLRGAAETNPLTDARAVFRQIHDRYVGKRFTHVTFVQRTQPADGPVELWYEAIRPPGLVRVDKAPLEELRGFIYRADSLYTFEPGDTVVAKGDEHWITMLVLVDIYALPLDTTLMRLRALGVDLAAMHESHWEGRPAVVVGAEAGDTTAAQIWYDRDRLYPVRVIQPPDGGYPRVEFRMSRHQFMAGGWIEGEIRIFVGGRLVTTECYGEVRPHPGLPDELFDPHAFATRRWAETAYPGVDAPPECAPADP